MAATTTNVSESQVPQGLKSQGLAELVPPTDGYRTLKIATWIIAVFCLLVSAAMLYQHSVAADRDPWKSPQLLALKEKLRASPANESLRTEIRRLDLEFRQRYFRRLSLNQTGGWLLVGGTAAMLIAARSGLKLTARPHLPKRKADNAARSLQVTARSRWSVAAVGRTRVYRPNPVTRFRG
jgi:hypothetical protein